MRPHLLRPLLVLVFLVALNCWLSLWSLVGGAYHLELMFWPWKLGLSLSIAVLVTMLAAEVAAARPVWRLGLLIALVMTIAGGVTYYYHLNEPLDGEDSGDEPILKTGFKTPRSVRATDGAHLTGRVRR